MLAIIVYGCISLGVFCAIYAALVFGADAGPVLRYFGFSEAAPEGTTFILAIALTKLLVPIKLPIAAYIVVHIREGESGGGVATIAELRGLLDDDDELTRGVLFEELGEDELEKEEARAAAAAPAFMYDFGRSHLCVNLACVRKMMSCRVTRRYLRWGCFDWYLGLCFSS